MLSYKQPTTLNQRVVFTTLCIGTGCGEVTNLPVPNGDCLFSRQWSYTESPLAVDFETLWSADAAALTDLNVSFSTETRSLARFISQETGISEGQADLEVRHLNLNVTEIRHKATGRRFRAFIMDDPQAASNHLGLVFDSTGTPVAKVKRDVVEECTVR